MSTKEIPLPLCCPITGLLMCDPVMDEDGHSYERAAIEEWLTKSQTSPVSRNPLTIKQLRPNRGLKDQCDAYRAEHQDTLSTISVKNIPRSVEAADIEVFSSCSDASETMTRYLHISVAPEDVLTQRTPSDIALVIDVSGSMGSNATIQAADGSHESNGLSILDIVKHAARTVIETLDSYDRIAIITYSTTAECLMGLTEMDSQGKLLATHHIESMSQSGTTNLWDGILTGLNSLTKDLTARPQSVMVLTDGIPNINPPRGILEMLKLYRDKQNSGQIPVIHTFGFGYNLNSPLLESIAVEGQGMYSFVPDAGFVGTAFVNSISNILSTCGEHAVLNIELDGYKVANQDIPSLVHTSWGAQITLGQLSYGQTRDVVLELSGDSQTSPEVKLTYTALDTNTITVQAKPEISSTFTNHLFRQELISLIHKVLIEKKNHERQVLVNTFENKLSEAVQTIQEKDVLESLSSDVQGQIAQAVSREDWYTRWGTHYLRSLARAHQLQICSNFRDDGLQHYGGTLFREVRENADDLFNKLPPPTPSRPIRHGRGSGSGASSPVDMSRYNNCSGPCFSGQCMVKCEDGTKVRVDALKKGMRIWTEDGVGIIRCVLETRSSHGFVITTPPMCQLRITPYHPMRSSSDIHSNWAFPCTIKDAITMKDESCKAVFSFLVEKADHPGIWTKTMCIEDVIVVTLAHGLDEALVQHPYYGTDAVVKDLQRSSGWAHGHIILDASTKSVVKRDPITTLVCGLHLPPSSSLDLSQESCLLSLTHRQRAQIIAAFCIWKTMRMQLQGFEEARENPYGKSIQTNRYTYAHL